MFTIDSLDPSHILPLCRHLVLRWFLFLLCHRLVFRLLRQPFVPLVASKTEFGCSNIVPRTPRLNVVIHSHRGRRHHLSHWFLITGLVVWSVLSEMKLFIVDAQPGGGAVITSARALDSGLVPKQRPRLESETDILVPMNCPSKFVRSVVMTSSSVW